MPNLLHVVGPPGCGKTTRCLDYLRQIFQAGMRPDEIAFVSFTKAAVREARRRVEAEFGYTERDTPYFATLHSAAYRRLQIGRDQVLGGKEWARFCKSTQLAYTASDGVPDEDFLEPVGDEEGDVLRRFHDWRRNCLLEMEPALLEFGERFAAGNAGFTPARAQWFAREFEAFKTAERLYDFCDFLIELRRDGWAPPVSVLVVDEAQDLSPLQREIVLQWASRIGHCLFAYDEDQTVYAFQGAAPEWLLSLEGAREFLRQSHRVPRAAAAVAQRIIGRNRNRYPKEWLPKAERGEVVWDADIAEAVSLCDREGGSWYFLGRNRYYLDSYTEALTEAGIPYVNLRGHSPLPGAGVIAAFQLSLGTAVTFEALRLLASDIPAKGWWQHGAKAALTRQALETPAAPVDLAQLGALGATEALCGRLASTRTCLEPLKTREERKQFFARVFAKRGLEGLTQPSQVTVSTIHGVKGGEAENVVLSPMMTKRTADGYADDPEPERRVWYVAASRTSRRLMVLEPVAGHAFDEW